MPHIAVPGCQAARMQYLPKRSFLGIRWDLKAKLLPLLGQIYDVGWLAWAPFKGKHMA